MRSIFTGYFEELSKLFNDLDGAIADLPPAALDWTPGPEMNSIGVLAAHTAGSVRYWAGDVALGKGSTSRQRSSEFLTHGVSADDLRRLLAAALDEVRAVLESLSEEEMTTLRLAPTDGNRVSVGWALAHTLAHAATHLGHIQLTRQLWEQGQP